MPELTVVTVTRNDLPGLQATVRSVEEQRSADVEHVIVDGASTDGSAEWLTALPDLAWRSTVSEPDTGIYDAMNKGLGLATGRYVLFLNAGDVFSSDQVVERLLAVIRETGAPWVNSISRMIQDGRPVRLHGLAPFRPWVFRLGVKSFPHQSTVLATALVRELGAFDTAIGIHADQDLLFRALLRVRPHDHLDFVADCTADGVSSTLPLWAFAEQMGEVRRRNGVPLRGSWWLDRVTQGILVVALRALAGIRALANGRPILAAYAARRRGNSDSWSRAQQ
ncbi:glycosyltransferase family 2 protein [Blastococcus sp. SYSU D00813]